MARITKGKRVLSPASLALAIVGIATGLACVQLIGEGYSFLVIIPSAVATALGLWNITTIEAPRE